MKKFAIILLLIFCVGCASAQIPTYLQDKNAYVKRFYADYQEALSAITQTLKDLGWEIDGKVHPSVYELKETSAYDGEQLLIMTKIRQTPMFFGTRYARMNIFLRANNDVAEIEIRYLTVNDLPFKDITAYRNDSAVERIFRHIAELLNGKVVE